MKMKTLTITMVPPSRTLVDLVTMEVLLEWTNILSREDLTTPISTIFQILTRNKPTLKIYRVSVEVTASNSISKIQVFLALKAETMLKNLKTLTACNLFLMGLRATNTAENSQLVLSWWQGVRLSPSHSWITGKLDNKCRWNQVHKWRKEMLLPMVMYLHQ